MCDKKGSSRCANCDCKPAIAVKLTRKQYFEACGIVLCGNSVGGIIRRSKRECGSARLVKLAASYISDNFRTKSGKLDHSKMSEGFSKVMRKCSIAASRDK